MSVSTELINRYVAGRVKIIQECCEERLNRLDWRGKKDLKNKYDEID